MTLTEQRTTDENVMRLVPLYVAVKTLRDEVTGSGSIFDAAEHLERLVEHAILTGGSMNAVKARISLDALLAAVKLVSERADMIKALLDEAHFPIKAEAQ